MTISDARDDVVRDDHDRHQPPVTTERSSDSKGDIEEILAVAALLDIEFDPAALSTLDPDRMSPAEAPMVVEAVKQRIHDGWMREQERQRKKAGRHGRGRLTP